MHGNRIISTAIESFVFIFILVYELCTVSTYKMVFVHHYLFPSYVNDTILQVRVGWIQRGMLSCTIRILSCGLFLNMKDE